MCDMAKEINECLCCNLRKKHVRSGSTGVNGTSESPRGLGLLGGLGTKRP